MSEQQEIIWRLEQLRTTPVGMTVSISTQDPASPNYSGSLGATTILNPFQTAVVDALLFLLKKAK